MRPFDYIRCASVGEACAALGAHAPDAKVVAGGTDVLVELRHPGARWPATMIDISAITALRGITEADGMIRIGPLTTHTEIHQSALLRERASLLADASRAVGSPQVRNRGTVGGNIMNAATCADTVPALLALGARLTLASTEGTREMAIADFFDKPYHTHARRDELLTAITFPALARSARGAFLKLGRRNALSIARISVAAVIGRDPSGVITDARIVPGSALPVWRRLDAVEATLIGQRPTAELLAAAGDAVSAAMIEATGRRWSTEYKEPVLAVMVRRALTSCCADEVVS